MADAQVMVVAGHEVRITSPDKVIFPETGHTKLDLVRYYLSVAPGALRGVEGRPMILKRFPRGVGQEAFFQKRAPDRRPGWIEVAELRYPSGRTAEEVVVRDPAQLAWVVNLGCVDLNPHPVRAADLDHPDELRVDLDPVPGVEWAQVVDVAQAARQVLADFGLTAWPKTSGSRGFHVYARIEPRWTFPEVRLAAEAVAREVERRMPGAATSRWWKEEREGVFVDYNQNARDHTVASAYSVRPTPDARVSTPLTWPEVGGCRPEEFTVDTVPARFREIGDPWEGIEDARGSLDLLLAFAESLPPQEPTRKGGIPVVEVARARTKEEALAGLERWKTRHAPVVAHLRPADVLVDSMRGRSSTWTRIRINLRHVPQGERPPQEPLEVDYDPWAQGG
ncbi:DNA polymerase domain-containing protein [Microtetraspora sp. NBRC 13810]|uniref:non-homologous end-joining DNA ligase n=1 Tax=Microtetraspora sp. NBRC 13810 TaxID=3030990 RepID=UPI0024A399BE|nr:non-homologous end-joining DNA ligase [Microtetraspora sp. NBRC 13810]GLW06588.1 DNA polymerase domain-containing protein [Microtetraspora sp. NBRC 13810]